MTLRVLSIDLSLTATGVVYPDGVSGVMGWARKRNTPKGGMTVREQRELHGERLTRANHWMTDTLSDPEMSVDVVVMEGYSFGSKDGQAFNRAEIRGVIRYAAIRFGVPFVEVSPATIKMFGTGTGNASKPAMLVAARDRLGYDGLDDNEADALWLWHLTHQYLRSGVSTVKLPQTNLRALTGKIDDIDWQRERNPL